MIKRFNKNLNIKNPYPIKFKIKEEEYWFQCGIRTITEINHPSLEQFETLQLNSQGEYFQSDYLTDIANTTYNLLRYVFKNDLKANILFSPIKKSLRVKSLMFVYSIQKVGVSKQINFSKI